MGFKDVFTAKVSGGNVVIKLNIDALKISAESYYPMYGIEEKVKVKNKQKFAQEICKVILERDEDDDGVPAFFRVIDELYIEMFEDNNDCLRITEVDEDE